MIKESRRNFLKQLAACSCSTVACGYLPSLFNNPAFAATGNGTKVLMINMNGGWDGLTILQPSSGSLYNAFSNMRPTLKTDPAQLLTADSNYGFHPLLSTFKAVHDEGKLLSILNVGYENMSRSHNDSEIAFARGVSDRLSTRGSGFVNRLGAANNWNCLQAVSVGGADPSFEGGDYNGIQVWGLSSFNYWGDYSQSWTENLYRTDMLKKINDAWDKDDSKPKQAEARAAVTNAVSSTDILHSAADAATFSYTYPNSYLGNSLKDIDILFSSPNVGTELAYVRRGGFDTHSNQNESLTDMLPEINAALAVFINNMKAKQIWNKLIIVFVSEFGRTNQENDSKGTDHGGALPFFVMGGAVNGGIIGNTAASDLTENDWLPMKINVIEFYRRLITRMGYDPDAVFEPNSNTVLSGIFT
jgi:uncharacterized protein (DUF1501 family)